MGEFDLSLVLVGVILFCVLSIVGKMILNTKETGKKRLKKTVIKVWDKIKYELVSSLNLAQVPILKFDNNRRDSIMYVGIKYRTAGSWAAPIITKAYTDYTFHINLYTLAESIRFFLGGSLYLDPNTIEMVIRQSLQYECRHIWQVDNGFYEGKECDPFGLLSKETKDIKTHREDANKFVFSMAKTDKEKALAKLQITLDRITPGDCSSETVEKVIDAQRDFAFAFNPIIRFFNKIKF
jgi:hypothetical protein